MATFYKRYIPPKPTADLPIPALQPISLATVNELEGTPEKKRKRDRTLEEVAERKLKKLKKKGIDDSTAQQIAAASAKDTAGGTSTSQIQIAQSSDDNGNDETQGQGEFSHVKSAKKRHKLEKAAREARKLAEKGKKNNEDHVEHELATLPSPGHQPQPLDEVHVAHNPSTSAQVDEEHDVAPVKKASSKRLTKPRDGIIEERQDLEAEKPSNVVDGTGAAEIKAPILPASETTPKVKKRRHKLEGVLTETLVDQDNDEQDDVHLRKHAALLQKYQKSASRSAPIQQQGDIDLSQANAQTVVRDLSLPEAAKAATPEFETEVAALPSWLARPKIVSAEDHATFEDLGLPSQLVSRLSKLNFRNATPVQQALIPILLPPGSTGSTYLPGTEPILPDVAVSAPTGSGKTIAYLLPVIESLKLKPAFGRLSALIVVPTRELVIQVAAVAGSLSKGCNIKVGMATGNGKVNEEQRKLITRGLRFDPNGYAALMRRAKSYHRVQNRDIDDAEDDLNSAGQDGMKSKQVVQDAINGLVDHVPTYKSTVDILVATPGRLLEHLNNAAGFNLVHLQWLVIDEADKLLDNEHEGFVEVLLAEITRTRTHEEQDSRERCLRAQSLWDERQDRRLRKVILSATMTRDISKLTALKLQRPQLLIVRGKENMTMARDSRAQLDTEGSTQGSSEIYELPNTLREYCVPVGDGSEKPLVIAELISSSIISELPKDIELDTDENSKSETESSDGSSVSDSDSSSSVASSESSSSSDTTDSDSDSVSDSDEEEEASETVLPESTLDAARLRRIAAMMPKGETFSRQHAPTILIFTSSNETANRLSYLLGKLKPEWASWITTLVKANTSKARIQSKASEPAIVISTDRAARGLDNISNRPISHVVQYDVPRSLTSYVHRVGRTARAGHEGDGWTLFSHAEARWFVNEITKSEKIQRRVAVERVKIFMSDDQLRERYQEVLAGMRDQVLGGSGQ